MTTNRSSEEIEMRALATDWGRIRWPGCRVVHELVVNECRVDMAFIQPNHIAGLEIKSSKDKLDRWDKQCATFRQALPELWVGVAPKWEDEIAPVTPWRVGRLIIDTEQGEVRNWGGYSHDASTNRCVTAPLLDLLWADEVRSIAHRMRVAIGKREARCRVIPLLARYLTGDEIVREVCRELRGRCAFPETPVSDPPIREAA